MCYDFVVKNTSELTIAPDTHNLLISDFYKLADDSIQPYSLDDMAKVLNKLYKTCHKAADQPGQYEALKRAISPNYIPKKIEPEEIEASGLSIDALAVWALFTVGVEGKQMEREVAKPIHVAQDAMSILLPVLDERLGFNHQTAKPDYGKVARRYYDVEIQSWAAQP